MEQLPSFIAEISRPWPKSLAFAKTPHAVSSSRLYYEPHVPLVDRSIASEPGESLEKQERDQILHKAVSTLPEVDRLIVRLIHFEDMTEGEVGGCLAMPIAKVREALARAQRMLRARLA